MISAMAQDPAVSTNDTLFISIAVKKKKIQSKASTPVSLLPKVVRWLDPGYLLLDLKFNIH